MLRFRHLAIAVIPLLIGCAYDTRERTDQSVRALTGPTYDQQSPAPAERPAVTPPTAPAKPTASDGAAALPGQAVDMWTVGWLDSGQSPSQPSSGDKRLDLNIPAEIPGSEARRLELPKEPTAKQREIERLFPELPPLPSEPNPVPGPNGKPYTLADLQRIAAANSPELRQAASDVEAARGNMIQANAYPNPIVSYQFTPSNNGSSPGTDGFGVDQTIKTGGKLRLQTAAAEMALHNAELALRRARSDLATRVRNAYFVVLVGQEDCRVNEALARFTDEVYRLQARLLAGGFAAPYEPAALRAQAYTARLGYKQCIQGGIYAWKQLVATINVRQLPYSEVAGRVDRTIPYYDYDAILAYVLRNHTDVLAARNGIDLARYNLKLAQVTPVPDVDVNMAVLKDYSLDPKQVTPTLTLGIPLPIWDRNQGAIIAAQSALLRAEEEPHRVEMNLTNTLAAAYTNYKNNLDALEYYRRYILPDQVRAYRGAYDRRQIDPNASFGDVVAAQQTLYTDVTTYLSTLSQLWTSVTSVADLIQTDDLFEFARPEAVPPLPSLEQLAPLPCCHPFAVAPGAGAIAAAVAPVGPDDRAPTPGSFPAPESVQRPIPNGPAAPAGRQGG
jgi:cobalt-zinc-cadmium efflux system outer membrane protein